MNGNLMPKKKTKYKIKQPKQSQSQHDHGQSSEMVSDNDDEDNLQDIRDWSVQQVQNWLTRLNCQQYIPMFSLYQIDGNKLLQLNDNQLKTQFQVTILGHRKQILSIIQQNSGSLTTENLNSEIDTKSTLFNQYEINYEQQLIDLVGVSSNILIPYNELIFQDQIGQGAYGKVYKGQWLGQKIAIKQYTKLLKNVHFIRETQNISKLRHPNILLYMGISVNQNEYYLITEYLDKGSLYDIIRKKQHKSLNFLSVALDIALGMLYLHDRDLLHCDLKSQNILVDKKMKIGDFGLSRKESQFGKRIGTLCWMAPEIMRGEVYTKAADVYSYGMILWELVNGKTPFEDLSKDQIITRIGYGEEQIEIGKDCSGEIKQLIKQCLDNDQEERLSFKEIVDRLQKEKEKKEKIHRNVVRELKEFFQ